MAPNKVRFVTITREGLNSYVRRNSREFPVFLDSGKVELQSLSCWLNAFRNQYDIDINVVAIFVAMLLVGPCAVGRVLK